ncbi:MAG: glutamyl-tRNA reductase, partial [Candidatus Binataceae bacterium]
IAVRERLAYADEQIAQALSALKESAPALSEIALLSTCNRVEIVAVTGQPERAAEQIAGFLALDRNVSPHAFRSSLYRFEGRAAARHLFRVGASLDSMVVGEPQILGQLKTAYAHAAEAGTVGLVLHRAFHKAFSVAKRVRKATLIGHGSVSVGSATVTLAGKIFDALSDKTAMLIGAGRMAEVCARNLKRAGVRSLLITSRTFDHAVELARELDGTAVNFDNFRPYLKMADIVIGSLATPRPVLNHDEFDGILKERRYRPMFLIDLGVPRNFDARLNGKENVYLYDIDDLGGLITETRGEREREAEKAESIVETELESFCKWIDQLDLVPAIKDIRSSIELLRDNELERHRAWLAALAPAERERIEALTRSLVNKLLHRVLSGLREGRTGTPDGLNTAEIARRLLCGNLLTDGFNPDRDDGEDDL